MRPIITLGPMNALTPARRDLIHALSARGSSASRRTYLLRALVRAACPTRFRPRTAGCSAPSVMRALTCLHCQRSATGLIIGKCTGGWLSIDEPPFRAGARSLGPRKPNGARLRTDCGPRSHRRCGTSRPDVGGWWASRLVATAAENRLNI
jgi:hypothetical protein